MRVAHACPTSDRFIAENPATPNTSPSGLGDDAPSALHVLGGVELPSRVDSALICSVSCPGSVIIKTYDAIRSLREAGVIIAVGFHSPMERECLDFFLRGTQAVVFSPAFGIDWLQPGDEEQ
jgi:hypothetical protein